MRSSKGWVRQPPKAAQQNTGDTMRHHLLQSNFSTNNITIFHSNRRRDRHVHGSANRRQNTKHAIPVNMPWTIPDGMWQNTCSAQQHCYTVRQWRFPHSIAESSSHSNGKQHSSTRVTSIHLTGTRQRRTFPSHIDGTSESTQVTAWEQLQHKTHKQASHHAMDGETRSLPAWQVCNPRRWQHQLLQALEQGTQNTHLWIRWNSSLNVANSEANAKDGSQILSSNLAWQRHFNKREHLGHYQQSSQVKNHQKTSQAWEVKQATPGCHQQHTDDNSNGIKLHATRNKDDGQTADNNRDTDNLTTRWSTSYNDSTAINTQSTATSHHRCANGNSTFNTNGKGTIAYANTEAWCGRWSSRRKCVQATKDGNKTDSTSKTRSNTWTTNNKNKDHRSDHESKERTRDQSSVQRRWAPSNNREDPTGTMGQEHRRIE